jgi:probable F420-dependent oxidoreductase
VYDDARTGLAIQAESLGYPTAWLGFGRAPVSDLALAERILDATSAITVATAIINIWANDAADVAASYRRIAARHSDRFLLGIGIGHPESVTAYRQPYATMVDYLDQLDAGGVPPDRRILAALGPRALHLAAERTLGTHPYLTVPDHTRATRQMLGPGAVIAPEHTVVLDTDPDRARATGRAFVSDPYLKLSNYTGNLRRYGYTDADIDDGGSDRLIDALVLHGSPISSRPASAPLWTPGQTTSRSRFSPATATSPYRPTSNSLACCCDLPSTGRARANAVRRQPGPRPAWRS